MTERDIFIAAVQKDGAAERDAYLREACGVDTALRERVEGLLRAYENAGSFLESPALSPSVSGGASDLAENPGTVIGPYTLLERIGEGGMGVVYMAEQMQPVRRKVALKLIKPGMDTRQVIARFEAERQALALMDHPNIARILDAGATESGRPYFVMELVRGVPITEYCDRNQLAIADRLDLFALVCQAVQHAHQQGIIHRDLKPSNVLIALHDGVPVPRVIDFGIAKATGQQSLTDKTLYTGLAELIGTPMYLSPEQAELSGIDVDIRSDVYSLGVLLYELLTGTTPFDHDTLRRAALDEVRRIIREEEPPAPSTRMGALEGRETTVSTNRQVDPRRLNHLLRGELDWITMKALEKDRSRRYDTAGDFAADIARYRGNRPVEAGPPSAWYRGRKFARRHRVALTMSAIVAMSLAVVAGTWTWSAGRLDRADRAVEQSRYEIQRAAIEARHHRYSADIRQAHALAQNGQWIKALELLRKYRPAPGEEDVREFCWYYLMRLCHGERRSLRGHRGAVYHAGFSPDGRTLVSCGQDGTVRLWDVATGRAGRSFSAPGRPDEVNWAEFSPDGRTLVSAGDDGQVRLWDVATGGLRATIAAHEGEASARFTPDGRRLISAGRKDGLVKLWDLATHQPVKAIKASDREIENIVFSPDGKTLATTGTDGTVRLWDLADLSPRKSIPVRKGAVYGLAFSSDGARLATGDGYGLLRLWNLSSGEHQTGFRGREHTEDIQAVSFLAGDRIIVSAGGSAHLKLWDAATGQSLGSLLGHTRKIWGLSVSPDGETLASASSDGSVKLWDARAPRQDRTLPPLTDRNYGPMDFCFTPDGRTVIIARTIGQWYYPLDGSPGYLAAADFEVGGFDANTGATRFHRVLARKMRAYGPRILSEGALVVLDSPDDRGSVWEVATGKRLDAIGPFMEILGAGDHGLIVKRPRAQLEVVEEATGKTRLVLKGGESWICVASSANRNLAALRRDLELGIWDLSTNQVVRQRRGAQGQRDHRSAAFSPDGTSLALGYANGNFELWDVATLELRRTLLGHSQGIDDCAFSHDGRTLISVSSGEGTARLWDAATGEDLLILCPPIVAPSSSMRLSPDGRTAGFRTGKGEESWLYLVPTALPADVESEEDP